MNQQGIWGKQIKQAYLPSQVSVPNTSERIMAQTSQVRMLFNQKSEIPASQ